jgi:alpha-D-ribose 1-methylphosphonate 5-triphosphate synthase subunit PhnH
MPAALPVEPDSIAIQPASLEALHAQPASVVTATETRPPLEPTTSVVLLNWNEQGAGAWLSSTRSDPTVMAPVRAFGTGFAMTVKPTSA